MATWLSVRLRDSLERGHRLQISLNRPISETMREKLWGGTRSENPIDHILVSHDLESPGTDSVDVFVEISNRQLL